MGSLFSLHCSGSLLSSDEVTPHLPSQKPLGPLGPSMLCLYPCLSPSPAPPMARCSGSCRDIGRLRCLTLVPHQGDGSCQSVTRDSFTCRIGWQIQIMIVLVYPSCLVPESGPSPGSPHSKNATLKRLGFRKKKTKWPKSTELESTGQALGFFILFTMTLLHSVWHPDMQMPCVNTAESHHETIMWATSYQTT